jgi:hypothetical protein
MQFGVRNNTIAVVVPLRGPTPWDGESQVGRCRGAD